MNLLYWIIENILTIIIVIFGAAIVFLLHRTCKLENAFEDMSVYLSDVARNQDLRMSNMSELIISMDDLIDNLNQRMGVLSMRVDNLSERMCKNEESIADTNHMLTTSMDNQSQRIDEIESEAGRRILTYDQKITDISDRTKQLKDRLQALETQTIELQADRLKDEEE